MTTQIDTNTIPFNEISEPGTFVCNWNGHLLQIPKRGLTNGTPCWNMFGQATLDVTRISEDWEITLDEARKIATENSVTISF